MTRPEAEARDQAKSLQIENDHLKRRVACLTKELDHTKYWAGLYQARLAEIAGKVNGLLAKYADGLAGQQVQPDGQNGDTRAGDTDSKTN